MIQISNIIRSCYESYKEQFQIYYRHPDLYFVCIDEQFANVGEDSRRYIFYSKVKIEPELIEHNSQALSLILCLVTPEELASQFQFLKSNDGGHHWIEMLAAQQFRSISAFPKPLAKVPGLPRVIHFYGYKGGQARSTLLAMLGQNLANDGYKVLAVDADFEAPSLDIIFGATTNSPSATLLVAVNPDSKIETLPAYVSRDKNGKIDLIPCRPLSREYDVDFAAFGLRVALDVHSTERLANRIFKYGVDNFYDVILFDHRSGITASTFPILAACPGPIVVCLRLDDQSICAEGFFDVLLQQNPLCPGAFVTFSLDPEATVEKIEGRHAKQLERLLQMIERSLKLAAESDAEDISPDQLTDYWIPWFHDRPFLVASFPSADVISNDNRRSIEKLRNVLELSKRIEKCKDLPSSSTKLSSSGATDEGLFIETDALRRLLPANSSFTYILGRKGTGKTRLLRELVQRQLGEPLLVAADYGVKVGLSSTSSLFTDLATAFAGDLEALWWSILGAALEAPSTNDKEFHDNLVRCERDYSVTNKPSFRTGPILELAQKQEKRRIFLIDGLETAFRSDQLLRAIEALFRFLLAVQSEPKISERVTIRLFLRTDLARRAFQNVEQQIADHELSLAWDTQSILNFVLSRIAALPWFRNHFPDVVREIDGKESCLRSGALSEQECEELLLRVFPTKLRRNNLLTLTFLRTYFSDSAGESASYYPRIYDGFLRFIADHFDQSDSLFKDSSALEDGRVNQKLILAAHERASKDYLRQVAAELEFLLQLGESTTLNRQHVTALLEAFRGLSTPFKLDDCVRGLRERLNYLPEPTLRTALNQMKEVGIFEDRPGYPGQWRVGRLFKESLGMKYVRG